MDLLNQTTDSGGLYQSALRKRHLHTNSCHRIYCFASVKKPHLKELGRKAIGRVEESKDKLELAENLCICPSPHFDYDDLQRIMAAAPLPVSVFVQVLLLANSNSESQSKGNIGKHSS